MSSKNIDISKSIKYGWESVKKDLWYFVGITLVVTLVSIIFNSKGVPAFWVIIGYLVVTWLTVGYLKIALEYKQGHKLPFSDLFNQYKYFWRFLGASVLIGIIVVLGFIALIIPGIYFALKYQFVLNLIVDKDMGVLEAMQKSAKMTKGIKMPLLGFNIVCGGVLVLGFLALGVGILVAQPVICLADVYIYRKLL
jgi:uncharacterized membrane protein